MKRKSILLASLCLSAMAMTFLVGAKGKDNPAPEPIAIAGTENSDAPQAQAAYTPLDEYYSSQQYISMNHVGDIESVWDYYKGDDVRVAVIDSGFDWDHPDFIDENNESIIDCSDGQFIMHCVQDTSKTAAYNYNYNGGIVIFNVPSSTSYYEIDGTKMYGNDLLKPTSDVANTNFNYHGTNVAATIAAVNHQTSHTGTVGIAPKVHIVPFKTDFRFDCVAYALDHVADLNEDTDPDNDIQVVNMSIESTSTWSAMETEITRLINQGVIIVAAAGNHSTDTVYYPASCPGVIGVGALARNSSTSLASYSNYNASGHTENSNNNVDLVAPGSVYASSWTSSGHTYIETSGTSFASPIVAGTAALWKQYRPSGTVSQFKSDLFGSCVDIGSTGWDTTFGYGRLSISDLFGTGTDVSEVCVDSAKELNLEVGDTSQIEAHVLPLSATDKELVYTLDKNNGVLSVSNTGLITALAAGTEKVWVYDHQNQWCADYVDVTVTPKTIHPTAVSISPNSVSLNLATSETETLSAVFTPANTTDQTVEWDTLDHSVATINSSGVVTPVAVGNTQAYCLTTDGLLEAYADIEVYSQEPPSVSSVTISPGEGLCNVDLKDGNTIQLTATVNGTNLEDDGVTWTSLSSSYASVDQTGLVTCIKTGYADIKATSKQDTSKSCTRRVYITDTTPKVTSISVSPSSKKLVLASSDTVQLTATVATTYSGSNDVTWETSNSSIATVSNSGLVTPHAVGSATITARSVLDTSKTATCAITVVQNNSVRYRSTARNTAELKTGSAPAGSAITFYNSYNNATQITGGNSQTWTLSGYEGYTISSIKVALHRTSETKGTATFTIKNNNVTVAAPTKAYDTINQSSDVDYTIYDTPFEVTGNIELNVAASLNSIYCSELELEVDESSLREVDHITAIYSGGNIKYNSEIDTSNLEVRAYYDSVEYDVVDSSKYTLTGFSKTTEGEQAVTVSYRNKEATFNVTVVYYDVSYIELSNITSSYNVGQTFVKPVVTAHYEDETTAVVTEACTFTNNSTASAGAFNVGVTYTEHNVTKTTSYGIVVKDQGASVQTGLIEFGNTTGKVNVTSTSVNGSDSLENNWNISTSGTTSFTPNSAYSQIGSNKNPATSITLTMTLSSSILFNSVQFKAGGFSDTAGTITIKVGNTTIGSGSLNGTSDVVVDSNLTASGTTLTITISNIAKGVKIYYVSYNVGEEVEPTDLEKAQQFAVEFSNSVVCYGGEKTPTIVSGKSWAGLAQEFNALSGTVRAYFQVETPSDPAILDAVLKHDQLVSRYSYVDFMGRTTFNGLLPNKPAILSEFNGTAIVIIASVVGLTALGGFIFIRKRKEQ